MLGLCVTLMRRGDRGSAKSGAQARRGTQRLGPEAGVGVQDQDAPPC
jgi:hypothetical protein